MRVIVIGAGILGAAIAAQCARAGAEVIVLEKAQAPATGATGASFGWINASFFLDTAHHDLRVAGMAAWRALQADLGDLGLTWTGALWWEEQGDGLQRMVQALSDLDYAVDQLEAKDVRRLEPALKSLPAEALRFQAEGAADTGLTTGLLLQAAQRQGAVVQYGVSVTAVEDGCVHSAFGPYEADHIVVAGGTGAPEMLQGMGVGLPMLQRPGVMLRTQPVVPLLSHVLVTPEGEIRQDAEGRLLMPTSISHQADGARHPADRPDRLANGALLRLQGLLDLANPLELQDVFTAWRPVPKDGLPVMGKVSEQVSVAVMHSGVTLAAIAADLVTGQIMGGGGNHAALLAPYSPLRFQTRG